MAKGTKKPASTHSGSSSNKKVIRTEPSTTTKSTRGSKPNSSSTSKNSKSSLSTSKKRTEGSSKNSSSRAPANASGSTSKATASAAASSSSTNTRQKESRRRVLSDEESNQDEESEEEEESDEDHDRRLGLRPTLRVVSQATIRKSWKPVNVRTRTHIQSLVARLFPAAITQARGEKRKIAMQIGLNRLMQKLNDCLSELKVPQTQSRVNYGQLTARNRELEAMLVPDLEHIRDLELRLEQEQILAEQDAETLADFKEKKRALDARTDFLQRTKLHPLLKDPDLSSTMDSLCNSRNDYDHISVADQRLLNSMALSRRENFAGSEVRESLYNPDQDVNINKVSKRLGSRLSAIERHSEGLDPLMQLVAAAKEKVTELSRTTAAPSTPASTRPTTSFRH
ncbi:hypothetical protein BGX23_000787 [Mortierella sp. AD031]|nr:hypothetical protein BGX23_000787 [Mortierella sp. AD031]